MRARFGTHGAGTGGGARPPEEELRRIIAGVRFRWRLRVLLRGLAAGAALGLVVLLASAWGLDAARFAPGAVTALRWVVLLSLAAIAWFVVIRPLRRPVPDQRIALYLEEHEPGLDGSVLAALEAARQDDDPGAPARSAALSRAVLAGALERARGVREGRGIEQRSLGWSSGVLASSALAALIILLYGPAGLRHGAGVLLNPSVAPEAATPYAIEVLPGDVSIPRGADQLVEARLVGFDAEDVLLHQRAGDDPTFTTLGMIPADGEGGFEILLFGVGETTEYFVESSGIRSPVYRIRVEDLPWVEALELTYRFPAYTGLEPRVVEPGGDIAVLRGTRVELRASTTLPAGGGRVRLDDGTVVELEAGEDGRLSGAFTVERDGTYQVELDRPGGSPVQGSPRYIINALSDQPPLVNFTRPGRDTRPSPIEEVFLEVKAQDDFGIRELDLFYSVNGGEERRVRLFGGGSRPLTEVLAGHTLYLEEYDLEPGDVVAYYARGADGTTEPVLSDMYFLQVRPFGMEFRQGEGQQGGQGAQGEQGAEAELSEQQRQVISATFNLRRDRSRYSPEEFRQGTVTIGLAQSRLLEQVNTLLTRMGNRGVTAMDEGFRRVAESLPAAMEAMREVNQALDRQDLDGALPPAQRALQHLLRAEEAYREVTVTQQQGGGGGGGGGGAARDLADLFELELDQLRNQYETVQRNQQQSLDRQVDETLERLKELARRQEQEAERQRARARAQGGQAGSSGANQRALADETEEAARQLERLARERSQPDLQETARQLQEAANAMRRAAAGQGSAGLGEAQAAADRLEEARRRLEQARTDRIRRDTRDALRRAEELSNRQSRMQSAIEQARQLQGAERARRLQELAGEKDAMSREVGDLERQLDRMAAEARREERPDVARELSGAAEGIREDRLADRLRFSRGLMDSREQDYARAFEGEIARGLEELRERVARADRMASQSGRQDVASQALQRTRDLVRGAESMEERTRARQEEAAGARRLGDRPGQEGQEGRESQQGQQGQSGQEGQQGQRGQEGQQGQQGQGDRQEGQGGGQPARQGGEGRGGNPGGLQEAGGGGGGPRGGSPVPVPGGVRDGDWTAGGMAPPPVQLSDEEIRQMRREARERLQDAEALRRELEQANVDPGELAEVIRTLRALDDQRLYGDLSELVRLQAQLVEASKRFEYSLRRALDPVMGDRPRLTGNEEIPEGYRRWVEEYYRALSRGGGR